MAKSVYFEISEHPQAHIVELRMPADLDIAIFNDINQQLIEQWIVPVGRNVVVDLATCDYFGSVLLGLLINIRQRTRAGRGQMVVCGASQTLVRVFRTANLERLIDLMPSRREALAAL